MPRRVNALSYDTLPAAAVQAAKVGILDFVGVTLAGCREDTTRIPAGVLMRGASGGSSLVFGDSARVNALDAALVNGIASHALDFDDCNNTIGGHPSAPILPALIALADETGASGRDLIAAYVAGFETECKLGLGVHLYHYTHGWHPTATLGVFGAAAACAKLMKLPEDGIATALAIAASLASGIKANFGTMVKPLHVGHCSRNGLFAALLARDGFTANQGAFEHKQGFFNVFNGAGNYDAAKILPAWARSPRHREPGHRGQAVSMLREHACAARRGVEARARIEARARATSSASTSGRTPGGSSTPTGPIRKAISTPSSACSTAWPARSSTAPSPSSISRAAPTASRPCGRSSRACMPRPTPRRSFPLTTTTARRCASLCAGGKVLSGKVDQPFGRTSANPLPAALLKEKFDNCARRLLPAERAGALYSAIQGFDNLKAAREVTAIIAGEGGQARAAAA